MKNEKKAALLLNPASPRSVILRKPTTSGLVFPASSKTGLHNYFAEKMAVFSNIIGFIVDQTQKMLPEQTQLAQSFTSLYNNLVAMRVVFLNKYHQLLIQAGKGLLVPTEKINFIYDHIHQFENQVFLEIFTAGIKKNELIEYGKKQHLQLTKPLQA